MTDAEAFNDWYGSYPRHVGKRKAFASWKSAIKAIMADQGVDRDEAIAFLLGVTLTFSGSEKGRSGKFCPYPATWLNQGRYDDDPDEWGVQSNRIELDPERVGEWRP